MNLCVFPNMLANLQIGDMARKSCQEQGRSKTMRDRMMFGGEEDDFEEYDPEE